MNVFLTYLVSLFILWLAFIIFFRLIRIVPEQEAWVVEQLGKYRKTMGAGLHFVVPFIQRVAYRHTLKEQVLDVEPQVCITRDNVQVTVDGVLYLKVVDPVKASYGIDDYRYASIQLAKTTMRSEIGKIDLDNTFSERERINTAIVKAVDEASDPWGVKVTRYEIRDILPPVTVLEAMERQVQAERKKRAQILTSEGEKEARINLARGERESAINLSKGEKQAKINTAEGEAYAVETIARATAESLTEVGKAISEPGGRKAVKLKITQQFLTRLGDILSEARISVLPFDLSQVRSLLQVMEEAASGKSQGGER
ncbi:band 7 protein [Spirochaeta thermophila DSM 6578]|uniref:Band 7 protein n=1 Tax=Winmispira thermophila (strain ATCC 700085 / DSM 6578 / Z-1203) TaxID=869211 RepID=G0GG40_WINT7|nr:slipin family protein [Spirochaeta thermophila]AEJ62516.1 band 7 protein [Spirochaeta thermophila DSM 6578]